MTTFPATDHLADWQQRAISPPALPEHPIRILVVDDSETDFALIRHALRRAQFAVDPQIQRVDNEADMRAALAGAQWDIVISDFRMPRFSASAALSIAKAHDAEMPFLIVSGAVGEDMAVEAMREGADDYVMKHNLGRLPTAIERAIKEATVRRSRLSALAGLQASEDYLRTLVINSPVAVIAFDAERRVTLLNPAVDVLFPGSGLELGRLAEHRIPANQQVLDQAFSAVASHQPVQNIAATWRQNDGTESALLVSAAPLPASRGGGTVVFAADITSQRQAEAARRESESHVAAISANLPGVLFRMQFRPDLGAARITYVSAGCQALFGVLPEVFIQDPARFMQLFDAPGQEEIRSAVSAALRSGKPLQGQWQVTIADQSTKWIHLSASVTPGDAGNHVFDGVITDVSAQKLAEIELTRSREELRRLSAHMESLKEQERMAVSREIHDDIGSILAGLKADAAWLRKRLANDEMASAKLDDMQQLVDGAVGTANRIIRSLRPGILDDGIVPALDWQAKDFSQRMGIPVSFDSNEDEIKLDIDHSTTLFRIFQEALTNIYKYAHASKVESHLFATASNITLEIRDNGVGMAVDDLNKETSFGIKGMMERARALDGWVEISGTGGDGTTVMVSLPRKTGSSRKAAA